MGLVYKRTGDFKLENYEDSGGNQIGAVTIQPDKFTLQYPVTLDSSPEFGGNKVVFFINVSGNGKISSGQNNTDDYRAVTRDLPPNEYYKSSGEKLKGNIRNMSGMSDTNIVLAPLKRLMAAITLYVPNSLSNSYSVNWSEEDLTMGSFLEDGVETMANLLKGAASASETGIDAAKLAGTALGRKILDGQSYMQKAARVTAGNSKVEQLFKGVDFRTFTYDYDFAPRSEDEAKAVLDIIRMFRHHMLPEYADKNSYLYIYPSEFEIKYFKGDKENTYLEKQMTAVLTNCTVNYTPNGQFNTFANGMPTQIRLQLQFKELGVATKETSPYDRQGI